MNTTIKTHYNPCFWTALWSKPYYKQIEEFGFSALKSRREKVYSLNLYSNEIRSLPTQNTFFEKYLGIADFNEDDVQEFIRNNYPKDSKEHQQPIEKGDFRLDVENMFTALESSPAYTELLSFVREKRIVRSDQKENISAFLLLHNICLLYTSPSPRDRTRSRMPSSA